MSNAKQEIAHIKDQLIDLKRYIEMSQNNNDIKLNNVISYYNVLGYYYFRGGISYSNETLKKEIMHQYFDIYILIENINYYIMFNRLPIYDLYVIEYIELEEIIQDIISKIDSCLLKIEGALAFQNYENTNSMVKTNKYKKRSKNLQ